MDVIGLIASEKAKQKLTSYEIAKRSGLPIQMVQCIDKSNKEYISRVEAVLKGLGYQIEIKPVQVIPKDIGKEAIAEHLTTVIEQTKDMPTRITSFTIDTAELPTLQALKDAIPAHWKRAKPATPIQPTAKALELAKTTQDKVLKKGK